MREAEAAGGLTPFINLLTGELEEGASHPFYDTESVGSSFFKDVMKDLISGAASEIGSDGTGWILGLLIGGDSNDDGRLDEMESDLKNVLYDLQRILDALTALTQELALDSNEVETYIQGLTAQAAVSAIKSHFGPDGDDNQGSSNTLKYFSFLRSKDVDQVTKQQIETLVDNINGAWDIQLQVQEIHDAIVPDIGGTSGLLDLWTERFLLQGHVSDEQLMDYYKTLERYFSALLFYQFKGANMAVEAMNYQFSAEAALRDGGATQPGAKPASSYLTGTFKPMIKKETDRFLQNVTRLIAENAGLYWESRFLPSTAQEILARATWFVAQTLGEDHYGVRAGILGTKNLAADVVNFGLNNNPGSKWAESSPAAAAEIDGRPYDAWGTLNAPDLGTLTKGTKYTLLAADFGDAVSATGSYDVNYEPGTYRVTPWVSMGDVVVNRYTDQYVEDPDGKILYGYLLGELRRGGREVIMESSVFDHSHSNVHSGDVNWWSQDLFWGDGSLNLYIEGKNKYNNSSSSIDMKWARQHSFVFGGAESVTAYLNVAARASGYIYVKDGNYPSEAHAHFWWGIEDLTAGDYHHVGESVDYVQGKKSIDKNFNDQIQVTLKPGHRYSIYTHLHADGNNSNGDYHFDVTNHVNHLSLTFVNNEFGP